MFKNPIRETVIAKYDDERDGFCLGIVVEHNDNANGFDTIGAMRDTAAEYAASEAGQSNASVIAGRFNWGDFLDFVPENTCIKHGFRIIDSFTTNLIVEHDEHIVTD